MKFNSKLEARSFLKNKKDNNSNITDEEKTALKEYFTDDEIKNSVFLEFNFNDCLRNGIDAKPCQPHIFFKSS